MFFDQNASKGGDIMKKSIHRLVFLLSPLLCALFVCAGAADLLTPDRLMLVSPNDEITPSPLPLSLSYTEDRAMPASSDTSEQARYLDARLMMLGFFPVKEVSIELTDRKIVAVGGQPFGIRLYTDGLVAASTAQVCTDEGSFSPSEAAGIRGGDVLLSVDGVPLRTNEQLSAAAEKSGGKPLSIEVRRDGKVFTCTPAPLRDSVTGKYRLGINVRDSIAGIGTMTYTDPADNSFSGLGHGICDSTSGCLMPLLRGEITSVEISSVTRSTCGAPGTLTGEFSSGEPLGSLTENTERGVKGRMKNAPRNTRMMPLAFKQEIVRGPATLLTTIEGSEPEEYSIEIEDISYNDNSSCKNMIVRITDKRLLDKTGGIVQGMSGSPVIQNGRLCAALTHVLVNDPSRGYAVFLQ